MPRSSTSTNVKLDSQPNYFSLIANRIETAYAWRKKVPGHLRPLWPNQHRAISRIAAAVRDGKGCLLLKKPPGAGKTCIYSFVTAAVRENTVTLISNNSLRRDTRRSIDFELELAASHLRKNQPTPAVYVIVPGEQGKTANQQIKGILEAHEKNKTPFNIVLNYQALLAASRSDPQLISYLRSQLGLLICDESHRSVGAVTKLEVKGVAGITVSDIVSHCNAYLESSYELFRRKLVELNILPGDKDLLYTVCRTLLSEAYKDLSKKKLSVVQSAKINSYADALYEVLSKLHEHNLFDLGTSEKSFEFINTKLQELTTELVQNLLTNDQGTLLHLIVTATPGIAGKDVGKEYGAHFVDSSTFQEIADEEGTIIIPKRRGVGEAVYFRAGSARASVAEMERRISEGKFKMADGRSVPEAVIQDYLSLWKENDGYLPAVAKCGTIAEADARTREFLSHGIKAVRCTGPNDQFPAGLDTDEAKRRLELPKDDPDRIDIVVTVKQVGEGWDVQTLRCVVFFTLVRSEWEVVQTCGRITRTLDPSSELPKKTRDNVWIIEPDWIVRAQPCSNERPEIPAKLPTSQERVRTSKGPRAVVKRSEELRHPNTLSLLAASGEITASTAVEQGIQRAVKVVFIPDDLDRIRVLLGSIDALIENGSPKDLSKLVFTNDQFGWRVRGGQIMRALGLASDGHGAARELARLLWQEKATEILFDCTNDDHLRALIGSPGSLAKQGQICERATWGKKFNCTSRKWQISVSDLGLLLHGRKMWDTSELETLVARLWPAQQSKNLPCFERLDSVRKLVGSPENLTEGDIWTKVFHYEKWKISGWELVKKLAPILKFQNDDVAAAIASFLFPGAETKTPELLDRLDGSTSGIALYEADVINVFKTAIGRGGGLFHLPIPKISRSTIDPELKVIPPIPRSYEVAKLLGKLISTRPLPQPEFWSKPFPQSGSKKHSVCGCRFLDRECLNVAVSEVVGRESSGRKILEAIQGDERLLFVEPISYRGAIDFKLNAHAKDDKPDTSSISLLKRLATALGMRAPLALVIDSRAEEVGYSGELIAWHKVQLLAGDYSVISRATNIAVALGHAARFINNKLFENRPLLREELRDMAIDYARVPRSDENNPILNLIIRASHDFRIPQLALDIRTRRLTGGRWLAEVRRDDQSWSAVGDTYLQSREAVSQEVLDFYGGVYNEPSVMPGVDVAQACKNNNKLMLEALSDPCGALQQYCIRAVSFKSEV